MKIHTRKKYHSFLRFKRDFQRYGLQKARSYELVLHWLKSRMSRNQFLILSGILVGCSAGLAGVVLKLLVHQIHIFITQKVHFEDQIFFYLVFPFLGIVLTTAIVISVFKGQDRKGIVAILYEIAQNSSIVSHVKMYSQMIQSAITVGLGGSAGLESPIAVTGAAIGSNFAQTYKLDYRERTLLLAAGATAGIAAAFNAPIAGMMFAFEILLTGVVFSDFIPLVIAAVCGSMISKLVLREDVLFGFTAREAFDYRNLAYYLVLGVFAGLYARYFIIVSQKVEHVFKSMKLSMIKKAMVGGLALSLLCVAFPPLFGEGYGDIKLFASGQASTLLNHSFFRYFAYQDWFIILFLALICVFKAFATSITIFSGGNGGNFAPSLFAGGTLGFLFATVCHQLGFVDVPTSNLVLIGMAGVMSGALYAPLTAIFLIAESSSGYDLFIPLMIVSLISYFINRWFAPIWPDLQAMADKGKIFTREHDRNLLSTLMTRDFIDTSPQVIHKDADLKDMLEVIRNGKKNVFGIVNEENHLLGTLTLDDLRPVLFNEEIHETLPIIKLMKAPTAVIKPDDDLPKVVQIFDETGNWQLPVVNDNDEFVGFISKSAILTKYRELLKQYSK